MSPAFDLNPVLFEEKVPELTTWISEEGPEASLDLAHHAAPYFALETRQTEQIIGEVSEATANQRKVVRQLGMKAFDVAAYASAFFERFSFSWNRTVRDSPICSDVVDVVSFRTEDGMDAETLFRRSADERQPTMPLNAGPVELPWRRNRISQKLPTSARVRCVDRNAS